MTKNFVFCKKIIKGEPFHAFLQVSLILGPIYMKDLKA